ncbi:cryptochrome/photolyase family protein [Chelatococcus reniformis]|uniref:Cryptochrome/photolyase family protein n=1 Tax=Chelatococcus reniformis TaxID=1494448 RepID=A0A916UTD2_9HYPH|nr:cryptochrome/photolyase family protein [Chelatococcus reniformis]GGC85886.1 cryptochrome/photolyase family protein [Chelatococcus reniformis]
MRLRHLVLVLGDQLDGQSAAFDDFDPGQDAVLQMEVREEATYVPQHKRRLAFFFSAMRHFRDEQRGAGRRVHYSELDDPANRGTIPAEARRWAEALRPRKLIVLQPGDWRVREQLARLGWPIEFRADRHFLCPADAFADFAEEHPGLVMEPFYRFMRLRLGVLLDPDGRPAGGAWNYDTDNRAAFGRSGPPPCPRERSFAPDGVTRGVLALVERAFPHNPGRLGGFDLPVMRSQALAALDDFVEHRLGYFGRFQDVMRIGEPVLFHSHLSGPLNLHFLRPAEVLEAVIANPAGAPLNSVEGFVRQVIGWREFVHGIYWRFMPGYAEENALGADLPMPRFYWTGETDMRCLAEAIGHTIDHAYAHHIERLMVLGLFALLLGVRPYDVHRWHMSMFSDAIDWVSLPNALGMGQHGDGGVVGTKPYAASGSYISKMSNYCRHCRYDPHKALGDDACPFTTLYWDFLARHAPRFARNPRMKYPYVHLARKDADELAMIRRRAAALKTQLTAEAFL